MNKKIRQILVHQDNYLCIQLLFIQYLKQKEDMNFCPCLQTIISKFTKKKKEKSSSYQGVIEFEEEEFMNPRSNTSNLSDLIQQNHKIPEKPKSQIIQAIQQQSEQTQKILNDQLNFKMSFDENPGVKQTKKQSRDIQQLLRQQLDGSAVSKVEEIVLTKSNQVYQQFSEHIMYETFSINLDPLDPYYNLLMEKTNKINNIFDKIGEKIEISFPNKAHLQIQLLDSKINNYIIRYTLNCSYSYYLSVYKSDKLLHDFNKLIAQARTIQSVKSNLTLNTLKFNKIGSFEARDCYYVKYQNGGKRQHWQVYLNGEKGQGGMNYKTCEIFCVKNIRQKSESQLIISEYLQCDLQTTNLGSILPKITNEFKIFLNSFQDHIQQNYEQESA